jgi:DNA adenine methylase
VRGVAKQGPAQAKEPCDLDSQPLNPPLKWAGGKRWLLSHIEPIWRQHPGRRYVEPFCGGLAVALGLQPEQALLNDLNPHLINFYKQIRRGLSVEIEVRYDQKLFYDHRARFNQLIKDRRARTNEAAQLFYYLNRTCFNGLCRFNLSGEFNVPFGQYKAVNYAADFHSYRSLFRRWTFTNKDLAKLSIASDDFIYADRPLTLSSPPTARADSPGTIKYAPPNCWQNIAARCCFRIKRQSELWIFIEGWALN